MKNRLKKFISGITVGVMIFTASGVSFPAHADSFADGQLFYDDFESGRPSITEQGGKIVGTENTGEFLHNTAMTISNTDGEQNGLQFSRFGTPGIWSGKSKLLISYEVMQSGSGSATEKFQNLFRMNNTSGGTGDYMVRIHSGNKISLNGQGGDTVNFEQDTWYAIDMMLDFEDNLYQLFVDGNLICSVESDKYTSLQNVFFGSQMSPGSVLKLMLDNFTINDFSATNSVFAEAAVVGNGKYVKIRLSESMSPDMKDNISETKIVNTVTGGNVNTGTPQMCGRTILIPLDEPMTGSMEYAVILPDGYKSILGKALADNIVYLAGSDEKPSLSTVILSDDYEDGVHYNPYLARDGYEITEMTVNETPTNVLKLFGSGADKNSGVRYPITETQASENLIIQYDAYVENENAGGLFAMIAACGTNEFAGNFCFNRKGKLASVTDSNMASAACRNAESDGSGYKLADCEANSWHRIMHVINRAKGTVDTYVDDGKISTAAISANPVTSIYFRQFAYNGGEGTQTTDVMYVDNLQLGYGAAAKEYVKSVRISGGDGKEYGPLTNRVRASADGMKIKFSALIDTSNVMDYINVYSGTHTPALSMGAYSARDNELTVNFDEYLHAGDTYNIDITVPASAGGNAFDSYSSRFTVNSYETVIIENVSVKADGSPVAAISDIPQGAVLTLSFDVRNITDKPIEITASLLGFNDFTLKNIDVKTLGAAAYTNVSFDNELTFNAAELTAVETIFTDKANNLYAEPLKIGTETFAADKWSVGAEGKIEGVSSAPAVINFIKPNKNLSELNDTNAQDIIAYKTVGTTDKDGKFDFKFKLKGYASGEYTAAVCAGGKTVEMPVFYVDVEHLRDYVLSPLNSCTNAAEVENVLSAGIDDCGLNSKRFEGSSLKTASAIINSYLAAGNRFGLEDSELASGKNIVQKALIINLAVNGAIENLFDYDGVLGIDSGLIANLHKKPYVTDEVKKSITEGFKGQNITSFNEFDEQLYEMFTLKVIAATNGYDDVREVMQTLAAKIGTGASGSNDAYRAVAGKSYASYAALKAAFDAANTATPVTPGGGGGGGGSKPSGSLPVTPNPTDNGGKKEQIPLPIFTDLESVAWAQEAITALAEQGIISGKTSEQFCPNDYITRAEFARIAADAFGAKADGTAVRFSDVTPGDWYYDYVIRCCNAGLIMGISDNFFGAADRLTRQDLAVILCRAAEKSNYKFNETNRTAFKDADSISDYARESVEKMYNSGLINGIEPDLFAPMENATRAQAAYLIYKIKA